LDYSRRVRREIRSTGYQTVFVAVFENALSTPAEFTAVTAK
jgi:hypothetical protein